MQRSVARRSVWFRGAERGGKFERAHAPANRVIRPRSLRRKVGPLVLAAAPDSYCSLMEVRVREGQCALASVDLKVWACAGLDVAARGERDGHAGHGLKNGLYVGERLGLEGSTGSDAGLDHSPCAGDTDGTVHLR